MDHAMERLVDAYNRLVAHYLLLALKEAGVRVDSDVYAEIKAMGVSLKAVLEMLYQDGGRR